MRAVGCRVLGDAGKLVRLGAGDWPLVRILDLRIHMAATAQEREAGGTLIAREHLRGVTVIAGCQVWQQAAWRIADAAQLRGALRVLAVPCGDLCR